jgi:aspartate/glutamate racemase
VTLSPTHLTLRHLRNNGWTAQVVEHWVPGADVRRDLFGFIDVLALRGAETLAVQTTTASNVASRVKKIALCQHIGAVREAGWAIRVHGWKKVKGRWTLARDVDVS